MSIEEITAAVERRLNEKYIMIERTKDLSVTKIQKSSAFIEDVLSYVCKYFVIPIAILKGRSVGRRMDSVWKVSEIRFMVFRLCRDLPENPISYHDIGEIFGRYHATVMYGEAVCVDMCNLNQSFNFDYQQIKSAINKSLKPKP